MSAINVFLAIMGVLITAMVITGMVFLKPYHLISPAPQTELPDVTPRRPATRHRRATPESETTAEEPDRG